MKASAKDLYIGMRITRLLSESNCLILPSDFSSM